MNRKAQVESLPGFAGALKEALAKGVNVAKQPIADEERAGYASDLRLIESYLKDAPAFRAVRAGQP